jgi:hypothetical protein
MIAPGAGVRVYLACGVTDMRNYAGRMIMRSRGATGSGNAASCMRYATGATALHHIT